MVALGPACTFLQTALPVVLRLMYAPTEASSTLSWSSVCGPLSLLYAVLDANTPIARAEVVLAVLIANFTFGLGSKEIVWNNAGVAYPTVGKESKIPEMPLKVSVIRS